MNGDAIAARDRLDHYARHLEMAGKDILELGPGHTPQVLVFARERGARRCVGLDIEHHVAPRPHRDRGIELDLYDGGTMPYADATFDVVWSSDVLEHVRNPGRTVGECFRVLRPGGLFLAAIDLRDHYFLGDEERWLHCLAYPEWLWLAICSNRSSFVNRLRASEWRALIAGRGFTIRALEALTNETLRRMHRQGRIRRFAGPMDEEDAMIYRIEVVAEKDRQGMPAEETVRT
jgi:SAM-dependent methyltransferase